MNRANRPLLFFVGLVFALVVLCMQAPACSDSTDVILVPVPGPADPFQSWKEAVASFLGTCLGPDPQAYKGCNALARSCLSEAFALYEPPLPYDNPAQRFQAEMWAGRVFLSIDSPRVSDLLYDCVGIDAGMFSGSGHPIPWAPTAEGRSYARDRGREYVAPNMEETVDSLWTWELAPTNENLDRRIGEIVEDPATPPLAGADALEAALPELRRKLADPEEPLPPVTRLTITAFHGPFPGRVAPPARVRAFFFDLRDGTSMSLRQAARASGFDLQEPDPIGEKKLYFWLFNPEAPGDLVRITWGSLFQDLPVWLGP